jgi:hypothetical protein
MPSPPQGGKDCGALKTLRSGLEVAGRAGIGLSSPMARTHIALPLGVALAALAGGCRKEDPDERGAPPPAAPSARPGVCASGGGTVSDSKAAAFFPREGSGYCVDPNGDTRAYGSESKSTLDDACTQLLDGECEVYKAYGLRRVVTFRYVDGAGTPGAVSVTLSQFASREGAFGFFTKRVVADGDPAATRLSVAEAGGAAALGSGIAYVYRGDHLAELSYTNESEAPEQMKASAARVLPGLARGVGDRLPGEATLPGPALLLPTEHRLPLGVSYVVSDVLGVSGLGPGAVGFYRDGDKRYRVFVLGRGDDDAAGDVLETLKKVERASTLKDLGFPAMVVGTQSDDSAPRTEWVVGRKNRVVFGVGDEELALGKGASKAEEDAKRLTRDEKVALLRRLVAGAVKE